MKKKFFVILFTIVSLPVFSLSPIGKSIDGYNSVTSSLGKYLLTFDRIIEIIYSDDLESHFVTSELGCKLQLKVHYKRQAGEETPEVSTVELVSYTQIGNDDRACNKAKDYFEIDR